MVVTVIGYPVNPAYPREVTPPILHPDLPANVQEQAVKDSGRGTKGLKRPLSRGSVGGKRWDVKPQTFSPEVCDDVTPCLLGEASSSLEGDRIPPGFCWINHESRSGAPEAP